MTRYDSVRYASLAGRKVLITGGASGIGCTGANFIVDAGLT